MRRSFVLRRNLPLHLLLGAFLLAAGALEACFGRPELFGDDISYLDITHLIRSGEWRAALNPLWSIGYPLLLAVARHLFPAGVHGTLQAVAALNLVIYLGSWFALLFFLHAACAFLRKPAPSRFLLIAAACIYVCAQIGFGRVSTVGPDQLVTGLFFLACALLLRFNMQPTARNGALLGIALGSGFVVKAIFLPLSVIFVAAALLPNRRKLRPAVAFSIVAALFAFMLPYAAALSWAIGRATLGESGALNYAYHVNQLPHWMGWQGGPPRLGYPLHPITLLRDHPAVFAFGEPFHVTYPPQFALHYWYDGYRHFFSLPNALRSIFTNLHALEAVLHENAPISLTLLLAIAILAWKLRSFWVPNPREARVGVNNLASLWPVYLPAILALFLYIQVHLEGRYVAGFLTVLALVPFLAATQLSARVRALMLALLLFGTFADLYTYLHNPLHRALHHTDMESGGQWTIAQYLIHAGLQPGDKVASVTTLNDIRCTWAYAARLHIVADIGNDAYDPAAQHEDFNLFWTDPATQEDVLRLFREQGVVAVIAPSVSPRAPALTGQWQHIPDTNAWFLHL